MDISRRRFLMSCGKGIAAAGLSAMLPASGFAAETSGIKGVGACDWVMGGAADPGVLKTVKKAKLDAVQVSVGTQPGSIPLRKTSVRDRYRTLSEDLGVHISSVAAGGILNSHPLFAEPQSAIFVVDAIEAAEALGANNVLLAFFSAADLRKTDDQGNVIDQKDGRYSSYKLKEKAVQKVVDVLKQVAPRAEKAGVDIGLENTLSARQNVDIIERVGSDRITVYYDMGNSWSYGYNVPEEIRYLGNDRICEVHVKDRQQNSNLRKKGEVDFKRVSKALTDINYDGWLILETGGSKKDNAAYIRDVFHIN